MKDLTFLAPLLLKKKFVKELMSDQLFKDRVVDNFASKKTRRVELVYKKI